MKLQKYENFVGLIYQGTIIWMACGKMLIVKGEEPFTMMPSASRSAFLSHCMYKSVV
jgi:hypothetical protein